MSVHGANAFHVNASHLRIQTFAWGGHGHRHSAKGGVEDNLMFHTISHLFIRYLDWSKPI